MPIKKENLARYPDDWKEISNRIRFERAQGRCECAGECGHDHTEENDDGWLGDVMPVRCLAQHGERHPVTGSKVVLTVAHLGVPVELPFHLHVTRAAQTNEIVEMIGFAVTLDPEVLEGSNMMYRRAHSKFLSGSTAGAASFVVALPGGATSRAPRRTVIGQVPPSPIWVCLTRWCLLGKPGEPTSITAKSTLMSNVISTDSVPSPALFTGCRAEPSLGGADEFVAARLGAGFSLVGRLLSSEWENAAANNANFFAFAATGKAADPRTLLPNPNSAVVEPEALFRASHSSSLARCRCSKYFTADNADFYQRTEAWSSHTLSVAYHFAHYPENCDDDNLKAMCQRCHLAYDADHHRLSREKTSREAKRNHELFEGGV